jgi:hypothetical protein
VRIVRTYSHLNGLEFLQARKSMLLAEIETAIKNVDAEVCRTKESKEKTKAGRVLYSPGEMNKAFEDELAAVKPAWESVRTDYWVCEDERTNRRIIDLPPIAQRKVIEEAGFEAISSYNQTDFVKDRVAVEVQFGKYSFVAYDLFVKHMAFYVADRIDVGVEIMPMKSLLDEMSSGPSYYERELFNVIRGGRGVPHVPLVLFGVAP